MQLVSAGGASPEQRELRLLQLEEEMREDYR